ncbi:MAG: DUF975 family protein [Oscillospiraceae bacterium]|nr:DUF975 family protein [Oscillospiraceae bacterium]MBR2890705.1 DUF975 family protein [Oscillospiraceae bacterium]
MKRASDFRTIAREALRGKWGIAVLAGFLAMLLGSASSGAPDININYTGNEFSINVGHYQQLLPHVGFLAGAGLVLLLVGIAIAIALFVLSNVVSTGYGKFNLNLVDGENCEINQMFSCFPNWKTIACAGFLQTLYVLLWSLILIIPGIIASYCYAMTPYILAEHPTLSATEAIEQSKLLMEGNRWRLFCLEFSFIGWGILATLSFGIGYLWLVPYESAARAAFYREISATGRFV